MSSQLGQLIKRNGEGFLCRHLRLKFVDPIVDVRPVYNRDS